MNETPCRNLFLESAFASKPWLCCGTDSSNFAFCSEAPVCSMRRAQFGRGAAQHELMAFGFYSRVFVFLGACMPQKGPCFPPHGGSCLPAAGGCVAEVRSVCTILSTSKRRNMPSKHQILGDGACFYHSAFQTGGGICPCLNGTSVPTGTLLLWSVLDILLCCWALLSFMVALRKGGRGVSFVWWSQYWMYWTVNGCVLLPQWGMMLKWRAGL